MKGYGVIVYYGDSNTTYTITSDKGGPPLANLWLDIEGIPTAETETLGKLLEMLIKRVGEKFNLPK